MIERRALTPDSHSLSAQEQDRAEGESRTDRCRFTDAIHQLEARMTAAAPGREREWMSDVRASLEGLQDAMRAHAATAESSEGFLYDIELTAPHLFGSVERLSAEFEGLQHRVDDLVRELDRYAGCERADYAHVRQSLAWLLLSLRDHQARETDLVFEVYHRDIGTPG